MNVSHSMGSVIIVRIYVQYNMIIQRECHEGQRHYDTTRRGWQRRCHR